MTPSVSEIATPVSQPLFSFGIPKLAIPSAIFCTCVLAVGTIASAQVVASPTSITWAKVAAGQAGGPKAATLTNNSGTTVTISSIVFTGTNPGDFAIYQNTCGKMLAASASCSTTILFKPITAGTRTATLTYTDSDGTSPQEVAVSGTGTGGPTGSVTAAPLSLSFGTVNTGSASGSQAITVTNTTSSAVTLSAASITGTNAGDFIQTYTTCGSSLAA